MVVSEQGRAGWPAAYRPVVQSVITLRFSTGQFLFSQEAEGYDFQTSHVEGEKKRLVLLFKFQSLAGRRFVRAG